MWSTAWSTAVADPFVPNHYVDISNHVNIKMDALRAYQLEMRNAPHSRSVERLKHLAHHRGHTLGVVAAEAFVTLRTFRLLQVESARGGRPAADKVRRLRGKQKNYLDRHDRY